MFAARILALPLALSLATFAWATAQAKGPKQASFAPDVSRRIAQAIAAHRKAPGRKVAVFDFDNTLIFNDIGYASYYALLEARIPCQAGDGLDRGLPRALRQRCRAARTAAAKRAMLPRITGYYERLCKTRGKTVCYGWLTRLFAGMTPTELGAFAQKVIARELAAPLCKQRLAKGIVRWRGIRIYEAQRRLIARLKRAGFEVWLVSASAEALVRAFAPRLGVPPARVIGIRLVTREGRYQAKVDGPVTYRRGKVVAIRKRIGVRPLLAFGDALTDLEMLAHAKTLAVVVTRATHPVVLRRAKRDGWPLQAPFIDPQRIPRCP